MVAPEYTVVVTKSTLLAKAVRYLKRSPVIKLSHPEFIFSTDIYNYRSVYIDITSRIGIYYMLFRIFLKELSLGKDVETVFVGFPQGIFWRVKATSKYYIIFRGFASDYFRRVSNIFRNIFVSIFQNLTRRRRGGEGK